MQKKCNGCSEVKFHSEFSLRKKSPDGFSPRCKLCASLAKKVRVVPAVMTGTKTCSSCAEVKHVLQFFANKSTFDGRVKRCKSCVKALSPRKFVASAFGSKHCSICSVLKPVTDYCVNARSPDGRSYRCRVCSSDAERRWRTENPDKHCAKEARRRALSKSALGDGFDSCLVNSFYSLAQSLTTQTGSLWVVDHTVPLVRGGLHHQSNLEVVPHLWNSSKGCRHSNRWDGDYPINVGFLRSAGVTDQLEILDV